MATTSSQDQDTLLTSRGTAATHTAGLGGTSLLAYYWMAGLMDRLRLDVQLTLYKLLVAMLRHGGNKLSETLQCSAELFSFQR